MDFFATGGFQQLFSDLHEQHVDFHEANTCSDFTESITTFVQDNNNNSSSPKCSTTASDTAADAHSHYTDSLEDSEEHLVELKNSAYKFDPFVSEGCNENYTFKDCILLESKSRVQHSFELHFPSLTDITDAETYLTHEMSDWEDKFLDNYIEIPELIEFLPEKTPLCTEMCEHFLQESSSNLRLFRKTKATSGATITAAAAATSKLYTNDDIVFTDRGYACTFGDCKKIYAKPAHLKAHLRRHLGEKPYICTWPDCTWKFSRSDELARHRRSHSGIKPYKCDYCMKSFARSDHLTKHRKVHERRMLAASKAGKIVDGNLPISVLTVRPGRKRKNQVC